MFLCDATADNGSAGVVTREYVAVRVNCEGADVTIPQPAASRDSSAWPLTGTLTALKFIPRFFLIIIAFVDNGAGIICYRGMSWSRNFLNYFVLRKLFFSVPLVASLSLTLFLPFYFFLVLSYSLSVCLSLFPSHSTFVRSSFRLSFSSSSPASRSDCARAQEKYGDS